MANIALEEITVEDTAFGIEQVAEMDPDGGCFCPCYCDTTTARATSSQRNAAGWAASSPGI